MSETSNGMPDIAAGDSEPSMEDILSSIRKIIADDKSDESTLASDLSEGAAELQAETETSDRVMEAVDSALPEIPADDPIIESALDVAGETAEAESTDDILDLINFAEEEPVAEVAEELPASVGEQSEAGLEIGEEQPGLTEEPGAARFDESLDLVMDSGASDYLAAEYTEPEAAAVSDENKILRDEIESEFELSDFEIPAPEGEDLPETPLPAIDDLQAEETPEQAPEIEDTLEDLVGDFTTEAESTESEPVVDEPEEDLAAELEHELDVNPVDFSGEASTSTSDDQDMDLVKSLLADLMDEPEEAEQLAESVDDDGTEEAQEPQSILDDILNQTLEDEAVADDAAEAGSLEDIARSISEPVGEADPASDEISAEDMVVLPERELKGRLSLNTKAAAAAAAVAGAAVLAEAEGDDTPDDEEEDSEFWSAEIVEAEDEEEGEVATAEDTQADEELIEQLIQSQEEEPMVRAVKKKEALVDEETEQESGDAFATLTNVVKEKADLEESGPPIGDLVQEALRPMLKEWLDKNLKGIVERAVTKEVKRISSGK